MQHIGMAGKELRCLQRVVSQVGLVQAEWGFSRLVGGQKWAGWDVSCQKSAIREKQKSAAESAVDSAIRHPVGSVFWQLDLARNTVVARPVIITGACSPAGPCMSPGDGQAATVGVPSTGPCSRPSRMPATTAAQAPVPQARVSPAPRSTRSRMWPGLTTCMKPAFTGWGMRDGARPAAPAWPRARCPHRAPRTQHAGCPWTQLQSIQ